MGLSLRFDYRVPVRVPLRASVSLRNEFLLIDFGTGMFASQGPPRGSSGVCLEL